MSTKKPIWTNIVAKKLIEKGKENGYDTSRSGKDLSANEDSELKLRPDVVWEQGDIRVLFEIDTGAYQNYQKPAWGSMLGGIILAKKYNCRFVQIVPKDRIGTKTELLARTIKDYFPELNFFDVCRISRMGGKFARENISSDVNDMLRRLRLI